MTTKKLTKGNKSKRISTKQRVKTEKKIKEHKRKLKKEARKMKSLGIKTSKKQKPLAIPNLYPYKKQMLEQIKNRNESKKLDNIENKDHNTTIMEGFGNTVIREEQFLNSLKNNNVDNTSNLKKTYFKELKNVLNNSDILLEVLDARDPIGTRSLSVERDFLALGNKKRIILVLNKIDLVPQEAIIKWQSYLSTEFPVVLFKSNLQNQNYNLSGNRLFANSLHKNKDISEALISSAKSVGSEKLLELIKNYSKSEGSVTAVTVGVVGYPNVGKSSLINSLKKSKAAPTSNIPGYTKVVSEIEIDSKVRILDCPGVVDCKESEIQMVLKNIIKPEKVDDWLGAVNEIIKRVDKSDLLMLYNIPEFADVNEMLISIGQSRGKYIKGGIVDLTAAGRIVLKDWTEGKIKYFTLPPEREINQTIIYNTGN